MDPFKAPYAFTNRELTMAFEKVPIQYGVINKAGIFSGAGIRTAEFSTEEIEDVLFPIPSAPWGAPPHEIALPRRVQRPFSTSHFPAARSIQPGDVDERVSEINREQFMTLAEVRQKAFRQLRRRIDITHEWLRVQALQGKFVDVNNTTLVNYFTEFGNVTPKVVDFAFTTATTKVAAVARSIISHMQANLKGDTFSDVVAFVRQSFFDELIDHAKVRDLYMNWSAASDLRRNSVPLDPSLGGGESFRHGSVLFVVYEGQITDPTDGTTVRPFIPAGEGFAIPVGTQATFGEVWSPAKWWDTVNSVGKEFYVREYWADHARDQLRLEVETNAMPICVRPEVLVRLTKS